MSQRRNLNAQFTRRGWIVLTASALSGCGGGSDMAGLPGTGGTGNLAALPGTGGTGIYAQGSISGFGSVIVNGIKFDDSVAMVQLDGLPADSLGLRLGMVATVQGERSAVAALGTAKSIAVWSIAQGLVAQVNGTGAGELKVANMTVQTDSTTVFDGIPNAAALSVGQRVVVWGLQAGADGSHWRATRVAVVPATTTIVVSTGLLRGTAARPYLNGLLLTGALALTLTAGQMVRVQGTLSQAGNSLEVASFKLLDSGIDALQQGEAEIEGLVTSLLPGSHFMLGSIEVDASSLSVSLSTVKITLGSRVEVEGTLQAGVLKATRVSMENELTLDEVEIEAAIEQFTSLANFVVRGQRCDASGVTSIGNGTVADLKVGAKVHLKGIKAGDVVKVTQLELGD